MMSCMVMLMMVTFMVTFVVVAVMLGFVLFVLFVMFHIFPSVEVYLCNVACLHRLISYLKRRHPSDLFHLAYLPLHKKSDGS